MSHDTRRPYGLTMALAFAGFALGTTSTYTTTAATSGVINGKRVTPLTAQTNTATPTTDAVTGAAMRSMGVNKATVLVFGTNAVGAIRVAQGGITDTQVGITTTAGDFILPPQFPTLPDDFMVLAYVLVRSAPSAAAFTPCTSSWTATGISTVTVQCVTLPDSPQTT